MTIRQFGNHGQDQVSTQDIPNFLDTVKSKINIKKISNDMLIGSTMTIGNYDKDKKNLIAKTYIIEEKTIEGFTAFINLEALLRLKNHDKDISDFIEDLAMELNKSCGYLYCINSVKAFSANTPEPHYKFVAVGVFNKFEEKLKTWNNV